MGIRRKRNKMGIYIGTGFLGLLALVFITLKLLGYISWSWLWILSPIWIPVCLSLFGIIIMLIVGGIIWLV